MAPAAHGKPVRESMPPQQPAPIAPPTSETFAEEANIEIKPEQAADTAPAVEQTAPAAEKAPVAEKVAAAAEPAAPAPDKVAAEKPRPRRSRPRWRRKPSFRSREAGRERACETGTRSAGYAGTPPSPVKDAPRQTRRRAPPRLRQMRPSHRRNRGTGKTAAVDAQRDSDGFRVTFSFATVTPAAMFRRADTVWMVFDSTSPVDVDPIRAKAGAIIGDVSRLPLEKGQAIRFRLNRPQMPSLTGDDRAAGESWTLTFADRVQTPPLPLTVIRNITDPALANVSVPLANPGILHRLVDPDAGDMLWW